MLIDRFSSQVSHTTSQQLAHSFPFKLFFVLTVLCNADDTEDMTYEQDSHNYAAETNL